MESCSESTRSLIERFYTELMMTIETMREHDCDNKSNLCVSGMKKR